MRNASETFLTMAATLNRKGRELCSRCIGQHDGDDDSPIGNCPDHCRVKEVISHSLQILEDLKATGLEPVGGLNEQSWSA